MHVTQLMELVGDTAVSEIAALASGTRTDAVVLDVYILTGFMRCNNFQVDLDKDRRTIVHQAIKAAFPNLFSETQQGHVTVSHQSTRSGCINRQIDRSSNYSDDIAIQQTNSNISQVIGGAQQRWPADRGSFLLFHMYKENRDTLDALHTIAKLLR